MKGKIAFVLGAAVGYVLGTRAGRERYEQIKAGAQKVWETEPVQKGVGVVRGALDERADDVKAFVRRASSEAFAAFARQTAPKPKPSESPADPAANKQSDEKPAAPTPTTEPDAAKPDAEASAKAKAAANSAAKRGSANKSAARQGGSKKVES